MSVVPARELRSCKLWGEVRHVSTDVVIVGETDDQGFRAPQVCKIGGITYRQLDYWARTDLIVPSLQNAQGSGSQRLYSFQDIVQLRVVKRLLDAGMTPSPTSPC
jgi:hypothetical protein